MPLYGRSREGAWIEIARTTFLARASRVAPARERGLKSPGIAKAVVVVSRSREGAWIEIVDYHLQSAQASVAPARERGLK